MKGFRVWALILVIWMWAILLLPAEAGTHQERELYAQAIKFARQGDIEFAFMKFHFLLSQYPQGKFAEAALFATAEYYFSLGEYHNASVSFNTFVNNYPDSPAWIFAMAHLLKIAIIKEQANRQKDLTKRIITAQQLGRLFEKFKEHEYKSPLAKKYRAKYFIDKIEFYINEELFTTVIPGQL